MAAAVSPRLAFKARSHACNAISDASKAKASANSLALEIRPLNASFSYKSKTDAVGVISNTRLVVQHTTPSRMIELRPMSSPSSSTSSSSLSSSSPSARISAARSIANSYLDERTGMPLTNPLMAPYSTGKTIFCTKVFVARLMTAIDREDMTKNAKASTMYANRGEL